MRLTTLMLIVSLLQVSAATLGQQITLHQKNAPLESVLQQISQQSGYGIVCDARTISVKQKVDISVDRASVDEAMASALCGLNLTYSLDEKVITVRKKDEPSFLDKVKNAFAAIDVHGRVVDENDAPLPGATVTVKGTNNSTLAGTNGDFLLQRVQAGAVIVIRYVGFDAKEVKAAEYVGNVKLNVTENKLDEVKVQAYGITSKRLSVANSDGISAKEIESQPISNPMIALQGRVPGIDIMQVNGLPGAAVRIKIQGAASFYAGTDPFYVVDGVPYNNVSPVVTGSPLGNSNNPTPSLNSLQLMPNISGSPLNYINPEDIERIEVLKDAAATAIYGSKAANGAIIITTKKGKPGGTKVDISSSYGISQVTRRLNLMNMQEFLQMRLEAKRNANIAITTSDYDLNGTLDKNQNVDFQDQFFGKTATNSLNHVTLSGGTNYVSYLVGADFNRSTTMVPGNFSDRTISTHFNINSRSANNRFTMQLTGSYLADNNNIQSVDMVNYAQYSPIYPVSTKADGSLNWVYNSSGSVINSTNPIAKLNNPLFLTNSALTANLTLDYSLLQGLDLKTNLGYNLNRTDYNYQLKMSSYSPPNDINPAVNGATFGQSSAGGYIFEPQLAYHKQILGGDFRTLIGMTFQEQVSKGLSTTGQNYVSEELLGSLSGASTTFASTTANSQYKYNAGFANLNYNYQNKYLLDITARRDGSSRYGIKNRFQNFGAVGLGWLFSEERNFNLPNWISFGKLRTSYGITGNDQVGDYSYLDLYQVSNVNISYGGLSSFAPTKLPTPDLQWETTRKLNLGIDLGFNHDRFLLTANYSINRTSNFIYSLPIPNITGFTGINQNFPGLVQNTSLEFTLNTINIKGQNLQWSTNINFTIPKQKLLSFPAKTDYQAAVFQRNTSFVLGQPLSIQRVYHYLGVDPATGVSVVADANGNPTTSPIGTDGSVLINTESPFYGGVSNTISFKGFQLDVFLQYRKQIKQRFLRANVAPGTNYVWNQPTALLARWQQPGDITAIEKFYLSSGTGAMPNYLISSTDEFFEDASFLRLKNLQISWNVPVEVIQSIGLQKLRVYLQGQNLATLTKYSGLDPETGNSMPPLRTIVAGVQLTF